RRGRYVAASVSRNSAGRSSHARLDVLDLDEAPPIWADRDARDGPTAYACRSFACSPPADALADAVAFFED
uniref:hypothetical protein n=1 Tax=Halostella sp. PRR32 TaxID=3098147 RepID=UPI002B1CF60E